MSSASEKSASLAGRAPGRRIVLTGTFCARNKGDAAMQLCAARALQSLGDITILSPHPEIDRKTYADWPVIRTVRRDVVAAFAMLARVAAWRALERLGIRAPGLLRGEEVEAYRRADLVVDLSGDTIAEDYGVACVVSHLLPLLVASLLRCPLMICAQTIGPFRLTRPLVRFTLRRATLITAREQLSFDNLGTMRLRGPEIQRTNDVAFLLEPASPRRIDAILAAEGIAAPNGRCLGVALSSLPGLRRGPSKSRLVTLFADVVDDFIDATGAAVIFLAHVTGPGAARDDRAMLRALKSAMRHQGNVSLLGGDYRPEEMKGVIGRCTAFMGVRMHANIAALGMNVPTLAIGYSRKSAGIMTAAGQRRWVQDIHDTNCEALSAALGSLWSNRNAVRDDLISRQADIQEHAEKNFTLAEGLLAQLSPQTVLQ